MNFKESKTAKNLARAFAGECQAGARYQFIAQTAESEKQAYLKNKGRAHYKYSRYLTKFQQHPN